MLELQVILSCKLKVTCKTEIILTNTYINPLRWLPIVIVQYIDQTSFSRLSLHYSFDNSIGRHFVSFLTCISCFYIYLVKYFHLNEKFILFKGFFGSEFFIKTRIGSDLD